MVGIFHESDGSFADFFEVERTHVACHRYGDSRVGVYQNCGKACREQSRLLHGVVVVRHEVNSLLVDVTEKLIAYLFQLYLGISGSGKVHLAGILLAEVSFRVDKRVEESFISTGHADESFVDSLIAMGVQLHGLAHHICGLRALLVGREQSPLVHHVEELAV